MSGRPRPSDVEQRLRRVLAAGARNGDAEAVVASVLQRVGHRLPAQLEVAAGTLSLRRSIGVAAAVLTVLVCLALRPPPSLSSPTVQDTSAMLSSRWLEEEAAVGRYSSPATILTALFVREVLD